MYSKLEVGRTWRDRVAVLFAFALAALLLAACSDPAARPVDYSPQPGGGWETSTPAAEGLDPALVDDLYRDAARLDTLYSVLIVKNGKLVAEAYFSDGSVEHQANVQSMTKSYLSALMGIALEQGCLTGLDQTLAEIVPEFGGGFDDPRKADITVRQLLQMRAGYPWEESDPRLWDALLGGPWLPLADGFPLTADPGTVFQYSNLSSYLLGVVVSAACGADLRQFAEANLFEPAGMALGEMWPDGDGYYFPTVHVTARDNARFGQIYLDGGVYQGEQVIPADWVRDSLQSYSPHVEADFLPRVGPNFERVGYGYQWWRARSGGHEYAAAMGHGGQMIALLDELDMVIVVLGDPFFLEHDGRAWRHEKQLTNLVADFIAALPAQ